jgi:ArsR family transcriptional regulator
MVQAVRQPDALLNWMGSLADSTRLRLLRLLEREEMGVVELCDVMQMPQSTISRHLKVLTDQGWTRSRRQGTANLYHMLLDELDPSARRLWLLSREQTEQWAAVHQDQLRLTRRRREQQDAERFFEGAAGEWDKLRSTLYGDQFTTAAMLALLPADWTVADLGCGTGVTSIELARNVRRVIGVDHSAAMLDAAKQRIAELTGPALAGEIELRRGGLEAIPIDDSSVDAAMMLIVLTYIAEPAKALREMARITKPGGRAVVVDLLHHDRDDFRRQMEQRHLGFTGDALASMMEDAGFVDTSYRELPPQKEARGPALVMITATRP